MGVKRKSTDTSQGEKTKKQKVVSKSAAPKTEEKHVGSKEKVLKKNIGKKTFTKKTSKETVKKNASTSVNKTQKKNSSKSKDDEQLNGSNTDDKEPKKESKAVKSGIKKPTLEEKPEDWNVYKKQKKELKLKRKQAKTNFDVVTQAKKMGELLRRKQLKDGAVQRNKLVNELHSLLKKDGNYAKFVLAHDTARIVQWLLKYSSVLIRQEIFKVSLV